MPTNPDFNPMHSSNDIWRNQDLTRCLTDDLDAMDSDISALKTGKANTDHTHTGYALTEHTHTAADVGAAPAAHTHDYAPTSHSHGQSDITGLGSALQGKADLVEGKVPAAQLPSFVDDVMEYASVSNFPETGEQGKIYVATDTNKTYRWSGTGYVEISGSVAIGETASTAYRGDRGKTAYEHSQNGDVHVTAAQKEAWDSKANGNHTHNYAASSHTHSQSDITGLASALDGKSPTGHTHTPADIGAASEGHTHTPASIGAALASHTHTPADIGAAAASHTHTPASIGAAAASHTHALASTTADGQMSKEDKAKLNGIATGANKYTHPTSHPLSMITGLLDLLLTSQTGDVKQSMSGADVVATFKAAPIGVMTYYAPINTTNSPKAAESWRFISHKTGAGFGWILGFSNQGSVYSGYVDNGTWRGWKTIYDANPAPLWSGAAYMQHVTGSDPQTVTPSKTLSECRNGWLLLWSDYDPGQGVGSNTDFVTTMIPKRAYTGQKWAGGAFYCDIPCYSGSNPDDPTTEKRIIKILHIYDAKIEGNSLNKKGGRDDVVLRAVYEF